MNQHPEKKRRHSLPVRTVLVMTVVFLVVCIASAFRGTTDPVDHGLRAGHGLKDENMAKDSVGSVKAFMKVYKVLMSPRCMNCHPAG
ncbi:MAG TPA: hypothetical protein VFI33_13620, partial [Puia sp.]|nr:hypothetical protein [Puia sp.]